MQFSKHPIFRWMPALLMMVAIFVFSATPSNDNHPSLLRHILNKTGHVTGYAMLTLSYWRAFGFSKKSSWLAWLLALLFAVTDEFHQSFVPGRHPAVFDVLGYDNAGALIVISIANHLTKQKQPDQEEPVVQNKIRISSQ